MKNIFENFAILLVGLLSILLVYLIVQYSMIEDKMIEKIQYNVPENKTKKAKTSNYLENLEGYGQDVDVKVDATQESMTNTVVVKSEGKDTDLNDIIEDKSKSIYMENLENYSDKAKEKKLDEIKPVADGSGEPEKLEHEEIVDEVGMAIDSALDDL